MSRLLSRLKSISPAALKKQALYLAVLLFVPGSLIALPVLWWLDHHAHTASPKTTQIQDQP